MSFGDNISVEILEVFSEAQQWYEFTGKSFIKASPHLHIHVVKDRNLRSDRQKQNRLAKKKERYWLVNGWNGKVVPDRHCNICHTEITTGHLDAKFCSNACRVKSKKQRRKERLAEIQSS